MSAHSRSRSFAVACALALSWGAAGFAAPVADAAPAGCPDLSVVAVPGTWETSDAAPRKGILAAAADGLPGRVHTDYIAYTATAFPWEHEVYGRSKNEAFGKARGVLAGIARACPGTRFAILGYSQGADAAGDLAAEIGSGMGVVSPERVSLVGLISDPRRGPGDNLVGPYVPGMGAGGPRPGGFGWLSSRAYTFCAPGDLYCTMPNGDFAGRIAGLAAEVSNPDPAQFGRYVQEGVGVLNDAMAAGGPGLMADQMNSRAVEQRRTQINRFMASGVHQSYPHYSVGGGQTPLSWLRSRLIGIAGR